MSTSLIRLVILLVPIWVLNCVAIVYFYATLGTVAFVLLVGVLTPIFLVNPVVNLTIMLVVLTSQSVLISIVSPLFETRADLSLAQGLSFLVILFTALISVYSISSQKTLRRNMGWPSLYSTMWALMGLLSLYFLYGAAQNGPVTASIYFKNSASVLLMILIGWHFGSKMKFETLTGVVSIVFTGILFFGIVEFFATEAIYNMINAEHFFALKFEGRYEINTLQDVLDFSRRPFLNLAVLEEIGLQTFRVSGPNMHSISYAYICAFCVIFFAIQKSYVRAAIAIFMLLAIQAKGPIIVLVLSAFGAYVTRKDRFVGWTAFFAGCISYSTAAYIIGTAVRDFHVIGLKGGIFGFFRNPLGHGLGAGGNLARESFSWSDFQNAGAAAFGVESAIGVLLYQIGIATFLFIAFYIYFGIWMSKRTRVIPHLASYRILALMGIVTTFNGLYQEEAYNFFSLGFTYFFLTAALAAHVKAQSHTAPSPTIHINANAHRAQMIA